MAGAGGDACEQLSGGELVEQLLVSALVLFALVNLLLVFLAMLGFGAGLVRLLHLLLVQLNVVVLEIPLTERSSINLDDGVLHEGLGTDKLIVSRIVEDINDAGLARLGLGTPGEVSVVELESAVLHVFAATSDKNDALLTDFGVAGNSSHFELSFLLMNGHTSTGRSPLLSGVPSDTHRNLINNA